MKPADFHFLVKLIKDKSGIVLTPDKVYLLENRLMPVARKYGVPGLDELTARVRTGRDPKLETDVIEAMTTNESFFFRDGRPFDLLRDKVLVDIIEARKTVRSFRIWCAAASSGQEPYSIAMILKELGPKLAGWRHDIVGTDISEEILTKAKSGRYSQFEVQRGLPIQLLVKYFKQDENYWMLDNVIRSMVQYRQFNLLNSPTGLGRFDIVFCRNVLIYFDAPTKKVILDGIAKLMPPDGILFLGGAETVLGVTDSFKPVPGQRGIYSVNKG